MNFRNFPRIFVLWSNSQRRLSFMINRRNKNQNWRPGVDISDILKLSLLFFQYFSETSMVILYGPNGLTEVDFPRWFQEFFYHDFLNWQIAKAIVYRLWGVSICALEFVTYSKYDASKFANCHLIQIFELFFEHVIRRKFFWS